MDIDMIERGYAGWFTASRNGADAPGWIKMLENAGVPAPRDAGGALTSDAPIYRDITPRKPRNGEVSFETMKNLGNCIKALRVYVALGKQPVLVVPNFGHFGATDVWRAAWPKIADVGGVVLCWETKTEVADLDAGLKLMQQRRPRTMNERKMKARLAMGRPKKKMSPGNKARAIKEFGSRDFTIPETAKSCDVSVMTLKKRMAEWTGVDTKDEAVMLSDEGKWPPKRKLR